MLPDGIVLAGGYVRDSIQPPPRCSGRSLPLHYHYAFHPPAVGPRREAHGGEGSAVVRMARSCALNVKLNQRIIDEFQLRVRRRFDHAQTRTHARAPSHPRVRAACGGSDSLTALSG